MTPADRIHELLISRGVKPRQVRSTLAKLCGISYQAVKEWFDGSTKKISPEYLVKIADAYDAPLVWLITGRDEDATLNEPGGNYSVFPFDPDKDADLQELIDLYLALPKSGRHAVLSSLYREIEKVKSEESHAET